MAIVTGADVAAALGLPAATPALDDVATIATALKECLAEDGQPGNAGDLSVEALEKLILSLS